MKTVALVTLCLLAPTLTLANIAFPKTPPYLPVPAGAAVILNSGSTNTSGYRIVVQRDGSSEFVAASGRSTSQLRTALAENFFRDLQGASPLRNLPHSPCMKSVSFGSYVFVYWNHSRSQDLSCPSNAEGEAVFEDALAIAEALHVNTGLRAPVMRPMLPGEKRRPLSPSPSPSP